MLERFKDLHGGVLVVGHGTKIASGVKQLIDLANQIQVCLPNIPTEAGFLEMAQPTIFEAIVRLRTNGVRQILVVPILLFEAAHAQTDIPDAVKQAANVQGISVVGQSPPLGTHSAALELSEYRFMQALRCRQSDGCLNAGACSRGNECFELPDLPKESEFAFPNCGRVGLALVGRGTSNAEALDHMRQFTKLRVAKSRTTIHWVETGFFAGGQPNVDELLGQAASSGCGTLVVQPHLLFEGELVQQLREKVELYRRKSRKQRWLIPPVLGADPNLANAFLSLANETLRVCLSSGDKQA